jgi:hypothetical protein
VGLNHLQCSLLLAAALANTETRAQMLGDPHRFPSCEFYGQMARDGDWCTTVGCGIKLPLPGAEYHENYNLALAAYCQTADGTHETLMLRKTLRRIRDVDNCRAISYVGGSDHIGAPHYYDSRETYLKSYDGSVYYPLGETTLKLAHTPDGLVPTFHFSGGFAGVLDTTNDYGPKASSELDCATPQLTFLNLNGTVDHMPVSTHDVTDLAEATQTVVDQKGQTITEAIFSLIASAGGLPAIPFPLVLQYLPPALPAYTVSVENRTGQYTIETKSAVGVASVPTVVPIFNGNSNRAETLTVTVALTAENKYNLTILHNATSCLNARVRVQFPGTGLEIGYDGLWHTSANAVRAPGRFSVTVDQGATQSVDIDSSSYCDGDFKVSASGKAEGISANLETQMWGDDYIHIQQYTDRGDYFALQKNVPRGELMVHLQTRGYNSRYTLTDLPRSMVLCVASNNACNHASRAGGTADTSLHFVASSPVKANIWQVINGETLLATIGLTTLYYDSYFNISGRAAYPFSSEGFDGNFYINTLGTPLTGSYSKDGVSVSVPAPGLVTNPRLVVLRKQSNCALGVCEYHPDINASGAVTCPSGMRMSKDRLPSWVEDQIVERLCGW